MAFEFWSLNNRLLRQKINLTMQVDNLEKVAFVQTFMDQFDATVILECHNSILVEWQTKEFFWKVTVTFSVFVSCLKHKMTDQKQTLPAVHFTRVIEHCCFNRTSDWLFLTFLIQLLLWFQNKICCLTIERIWSAIETTLLYYFDDMYSW